MITGCFLLIMWKGKIKMDIDRIIINTQNFTVYTVKIPHVDRREGGHIVIACKNIMYMNIEDMPQDVLHELIDVASRCGMYMKRMFKKEEIDIGIINYQINGNWSVLEDNREPVHMHLYGRAKRSKNQRYGSALFLPDLKTGFYDGNKGLTGEEIVYLKEKLLSDKIIKMYL